MTAPCPICQEEYNRVVDELNKLHKPDILMFPPTCPKCGSLKMTQVLMSSCRIECLDCHQGYVVKEEDGKSEMAKEMTKGEWGIFFKICEQAKNDMSNSGCNDFNLKEHIPDLDDRKRLVKAMHEWNGDPDVYEEDVHAGRRFEWTSDFFIFHYLCDKLKALLQEGKL